MAWFTVRRRTTQGLHQLLQGAILSGREEGKKHLMRGIFMAAGFALAWEAKAPSEDTEGEDGLENLLERVILLKTMEQG